jgi:hypothetical protein
MAAIDFPNSPTVGQVFVAGNGVTYQWNGTLWLPIGGTQALYVGDTPPATPGPNQLWWNSTTGVMYLWYNDGNSTQWVPASPAPASSVPAIPLWRQIARVVPTAGQPTIDFQNIPSDINDIEVRFDIMPVAADDTLRLQFYNASNTLITSSYVWSTMLMQNIQATGASPGMYTSTSSGVTTSVMMHYYGAGNGVYNGSGGGIRGDCSIYNIRDATRVKSANFRTAHYNNALTAQNNGIGSATYNVNFALGGLRLFFGGGNIAAGGAVTLWGSP